MPSIWSAPAGLAAGRQARQAVEVRSFSPSEFGLEQPSGIAYDATSGALLIAADSDTATTSILAILPDESVIGQYAISGMDDPSSIAFDPTSARLLGTQRDELVSVDADSLGDGPTARALGRRVGETGGITVDPGTGDIYVLSGTASKIKRVGAGGTASEIKLRGLPKTAAIAFNPEDGRIHVASTDGQRLFAVTDDGSVAETYDLSQLAIADLQSIVFAPSADNTDPESVFDLYLVDGGTSTMSARIVEVSLNAVVLAAPVTATSATHVRTTALSAMSIPSPDSSGVAWIRHQSRLLVVDSEVNEMPWLFNANATNVFPLTYGGSLFATQVGNTVPWTKEPTGVAYNPANTHIFTSDDDADKLYEFNPGPDGRYATSDDTVTNKNIRPFANRDAEDVAYDTATGDLWVVDGFDREVFRYTPGPDGKYGTTDDPPPTNWDVGVYGALDPEGIAHYEADDTLMVLDNGSKKIYVLSKTGVLLRTIGIAAAQPKKAAGLALAPPSDGSPGLNLYIVDRGIDNDIDPNENDGKLYEMAASLVGGTVNQPPFASAAAPPSPPGADLTVTSSTFPVTATLDASGSSDPENGPLMFAWTQESGPPATIDSPTAAVTNVGLPSTGIYQFTVNVTDSGVPALSRTASVRVIVEPPGQLTFQSAVAAGTDDAEETVGGGSIQLGSADLDMMLDGSTHKTVGMRFTNVTIPQNATIASASIQFRSDEAGSDPLTLTVAGHAVDNPATFTSARFGVSSRARTAATVAWSPPAWTKANQVGPDQRTADLTPIVQELVNRTGWSSGNAMAFIVTGPAVGTRVADSLEGGYAPTLTITYTTGGAPVNQAPVASAAAPPSPPGEDRAIMALAYPVIATLDASGSYDPEGGSMTYVWTKAEGSPGDTIVSPSEAVSQVQFDSPGSYRFQVTVTDNASPPLSSSATVRILVQSGSSLTTFQGAVAAGTDDAEEAVGVGSTQLGSSDLDMMLDGTSHKTVGMRFTNVTIPRNATVASASIQFRSDIGGADPLTLTVAGHAVDNPATFTSARFDVSSRVRTAATVAWSPPAWTKANQVGPDQRTADLTAIVQELVNRTGWSSGNAMAFIVTGPAVGTRVADSLEGGYAPTLTVTYSTP